MERPLNSAIIWLFPYAALKICIYTVDGNASKLNYQQTDKTLGNNFIPKSQLHDYLKQSKPSALIKRNLVKTVLKLIFWLFNMPRCICNK